MSNKIVIPWSIAFFFSVVGIIATAQHRFRFHDETRVQTLELAPATVDPGANQAGSGDGNQPVHHGQRDSKPSGRAVSEPG